MTDTCFVSDAWTQVLEKVQDVRAAARMKQLSYTGISGRSMFGVDHQSVVYLIEQLYGAVHCHKHYKFRFHKYDLDQADEVSSTDILIVTTFCTTILCTNIIPLQ